MSKLHAYIYGSLFPLLCGVVIAANAPAERWDKVCFAAFLGLVFFPLYARNKA